MGASAAQAFFEPKPRTVLIRDDCEPVSFNAVLGPGTCIGNGQTTFGSFVAQALATGTVAGWVFDPDELTVQPGRGLNAVNVGGEFHTFTQVAAFGGGCIEEVNELLGLTPVPECLPEVAPGVPLAFVTTGVAPGESLAVSGVSRGTRLFQCLIHPFQKAIVNIRGR